jgi:uncharacterized membrane protein
MSTASTSELKHGLREIGEQLGIQPTFGPSVNVGEIERWASAFGGGALVLYALSRLSVSGITAGVLGGALIYRAMSGHCNAYESLGIDTSEKHHG